MKRTFFATMTGLLILGFSGTASAAFFANPTWHGYALDWCAQFEKSCGKPAADMFCQKKGYPYSTSFVKRNSVNTLTMTIGSNAICNPQFHGCDSFSSITCQEPVRTFWMPKYNGYRVDWCLTFEQNCGAPAAQGFCHKMGYPYLVNFQKQNSVNSLTMTVGSNAICNPQFHGCDSFSMIRCRK